MTGALINPARRTLGAGALALLLIAIAAGPARAATYSSSTFSGSNEGWTTTSTACTLPEPLCASRGEEVETAGNPPGSLAAKATVILGAVGAINAEATFESPSFTVAAGGQGSLDLQRAFDPGSLVGLSAQLSYTATLVDKTSGQQQKAISETVSGAASFAGKAGGVSLVAGHTYAVVIESKIGVTVAGVNLGTSTANFDNVSVTGPDSGGAGGGGAVGGNGSEGGAGANGANSLTDTQLESLMKSSLTGSAAVKGSRVFVKAKCPAKVGLACRVTIQGLLRKGKPATAARTAKVAKGKSKQLVLRVKPNLRRVVAKRRNLLFKETVKAAKAKATVYKRLKLIRR